MFLEGSNFLTETIKVTRPDGRVVTLEYNSGMLNRLDRLTAANYGMPINTNLCKNMFVKHRDKTIMLQATSIYTQGDGGSWDKSKMFDIMLEISKTSLQILGSDLFKQLMEDLNQPIPESTIINSVDAAVDFANEIGYPVIVRPAFTLGGTGGGMCNNEEELRQIAENGLTLSPVTQCLIERSIAGFKEIE